MWKTVRREVLPFLIMIAYIIATIADILVDTKGNMTEFILGMILIMLFATR